MTCHPYFQELSLLKEAPTLMCAQLPVPGTDVTTVPTWTFSRRAHLCAQARLHLCVQTHASASCVCMCTCMCVHHVRAWGVHDAVEADKGPSTLGREAMA